MKIKKGDKLIDVSDNEIVTVTSIEITIIENNLWTGKVVKSAVQAISNKNGKFVQEAEEFKRIYERL